MNEGKPTQSPSGRPEDPAQPDGDFRLERPAPPRPVTSPERASTEGAPAEGDFELGAPAGARGGGPAAEAGACPEGGPAPAEGDFELRRPEDPADGRAGAADAGATAEAASGAGGGPAERGLDGAAAGAAESVAASGPPSGAEPGSAAREGDLDSTHETSDTAGPVVAPGRSGEAARSGAPLGAAGPLADAPKPLHDPDPYSTPPYGEPGPWAPAPPVQHPMATPAQGTAIPAPPPPAVDTSATHSSPVPIPAQAPPPAHHPAAAPVPPVTHHPAATAAPPAVDAAAPSRAHASAPPPPAHGGAPAPGAPGEAAAPAGAVGGSVPAPDGPASTPPAGPWQRYDPWAASAAGVAPLQQNGAAVLTQGQRRRRVRKTLAGMAALLALVSGGIGGIVGAHLERNGGVGQVELPQAGKESADRDPDSVAGIAARALPSVVTLHVAGSDESGTGTGFVLDGRGHILTNNHVVEPAGSDGEITVTFNSGDTAEAEVVGRDSGYDLAVVRVRGVSGLAPLPLGNSDNVQVGDPVVAIGAPFDLAGTVTSGIISAKERPITAGGEKGDGSDVSYVDALQTDAPINPGNSGGPLLDAEARVIGINSAIRSAGGGDLDGGQAGSIGLGFAIPINQGKRVAEELINTGRATHPVIGVTLDMNYSGDGARVGTKGSDGGSAVVPGGPGDRAGIEPGDVITEVDGQRVHSGEELIVKTRAHRPGDRLELTVLRDGDERTISLVLGSSAD
ncbi:trypsin-like peptidase domain-containing protein [Streptomyces pharetrae]|uniref:trypsin-like peptidase domain-containing protein n=1 Tax=Streptomyces pharetrae TaxID=291370 RepID=UPI00364E7C96